MPSTSIDRVTGISTSVAIKAPVRVATTANITLSALQTIDGQVLVAGDRVLVKDQTNSAQNGIYTAAALAWDRVEDLDAGDDIVNGTVVYVRQGSSNGINWFQATLSVSPPVIGVTLITWAPTYVSLTVVSSATETTAGVAEIATQAETNTGTDNARIVTPTKLKNSTLITGIQADILTNAGGIATAAASILTLTTNKNLFSANKNATNQTAITSATLTKVTFTNESYDVGSNYDAANSRFLCTASGAGKWFFVATASCNANVVDQSIYNLTLYKNGVRIMDGINVHSSGTNPIGCFVTAMIDVASTDTVEVYFFGGGAGAKTLDGTNSATFFQGWKVN